MPRTTTTRRNALAWIAALGACATEVERALAQDAKAAAGTADESGGRVVFENDKVRVVSHHARARQGVCGTGLHSHPPHLTIALTDVRARVTLPGKPAFVDDQKAGHVFWDPGGPHVVENLGSRDTLAYLVELKG